MAPEARVREMISIEILGHPGTAIPLLERLEDRVSEPALAFLLQGIVAPLLQAQSSAKFTAQSGHTGPWRPLKESTQRIRRSQGYGGPSPINVRKGDLKSFVTSAGGNIQHEGVATALEWPDRVSMNSTRLMYAYHTAQAGSSRWGTPARPVVGLTVGDIAAIHLAVGGFISGGSLWRKM